MPVESAADRLVFLSPSDFGCSFTYRAAGQAVVTGPFDGLFDNDFLLQEGQGETDVASRAPRLLCRMADLVLEGREGDQITIFSAPSQPELVGRVYDVTTPRPDGTGMTQLWLKRVI